MGQKERKLLEEIRQFDTPSVTNVVATYPSHPLCLGLYNPLTENWYTDDSLRCMYPELGALAGYAVTAVYGPTDPGFGRLTGNGRLRRHRRLGAPQRVLLSSRSSRPSWPARSASPAAT